MNNSFISKSDEETQKIGFLFAKGLKPYDVVLLYGDLGFGKTTFVKGVARGLGIQTPITSPTFTIIKEHSNLCHMDLYRIQNKAEFNNIGFTEIIGNSSIKIIEWPENIFTKVPEKRIDVKILLNKDNTRVINITNYE